MGGVEKTEHHTDNTDENHLQPAIPDQRQSDDTCQTSGQGNGPFHRVEFHPSLRTSPPRTYAGLVIISAVGKVKEVVDKVRINLHGEGKKQTQ